MWYKSHTAHVWTIAGCKNTSQRMRGVSAKLYARISGTQRPGKLVGIAHIHFAQISDTPNELKFARCTSDCLIRLGAQRTHHIHTYIYINWPVCRALHTINDIESNLWYTSQVLVLHCTPSQTLRIGGHSTYHSLFASTIAGLCRCSMVKLRVWDTTYHTSRSVVFIQSYMRKLACGAPIYILHTNRHNLGSIHNPMRLDTILWYT